MPKITTTSQLHNLSPLRQNGPIQAKEAAEIPADGWVGAAPEKPSVPLPSPENVAERHTRTASNTGLKVALGLVGMTGALLSMSGVAQAQVQVQPTVAQRNPSLVESLRSQQPVFVGNVQNVVDQFSATRQIYVVGNPQYQGQNLDLKQFEDVLAKHPNAYVVLIAESNNVKNDDYNLSRGIGNHEQFKSVIDQETGQPNGSVFMIYFKVTDQKFIEQTGNDRAIYMRSEQLLDDAGVGENNFVDRETREPRELMQTYVNAVRSGQSVPQALNQVLDRVDAGVTRHVETSVRGAQASVNQAEQRLGQVNGKVKDFQRQHGSEGTLGQPPVDAWRQQLQSAQQSLKDRDYAKAGQTARQLQGELTQYENQLSQFAQAPQQAQSIRSLIQELEQQVASLPEGAPARQSLQEAKQQMAAFQERYDANELDFQPQLQGARQAAERAQNQVESAQSSADAKRNLKLYGSAALGVGMLATALIFNHRARGRKGEAEDELDKALGAMGDRSKELIRVMNDADVQQIAAFTGTTQKLAKELLRDTAEALALMGGGEKILAEATQLIEGDSFGSRLKNMFATGNFDKAVEMLTDPEQQAPYELADAKEVKLEAGSRAEGWRDYLQTMIVSKAGQASFLQMLDQLGHLTQNNDKSTQVLLKESREVGAYLDGVQGQGKKSAEASQALQKQGEGDGLFTAPSITKRLIPAVDQLIEKGHEVKGTDPFRARQEFGSVGERMVGDANEIVGVGRYGRESTLPALARSDAALHPHEIDTKWAHFRKEELSLQLDRSGERAVDAPVQSAVRQLKQDLVSLESQLQSVVKLDEARWNVAQPQIERADQVITTAREGLCTALQAAGVFGDGKPEQVLREPDRDPSAFLYESRQNYGAIKPLLDKGNIEQPPAHLDEVARLTGHVHSLVDQSRQAFEAHPATLGERRQRHQDITHSIPNQFQPSLQRIQEGYTPTAQQSVVGEVSHGTSQVKIVGEFLDDTFRLLDRAATISDQADYNYGRAHLLTARDQLQQVNGILVQGQANLNAITGAEKLLGQHQVSAEKELQSLTQRIAETSQRSQAVYVRRQAKELLEQTQQELEKSKAVVFQKPASPYEARQFLANIEQLRTQVENTIRFDQQAYDAANSAIAEAKSLIGSADGDLDKAARTEWNQSIAGYGSVHHAVDPQNLNPARQTVSRSRQELSEAESKIAPQDYEKAKAVAESAQATAQQARTEVQKVVDAAQAVFQQKVGAGQAIASADSQVDEAERSLDQFQRESWSQHVSGFGQVTHQVDRSDLVRARSILEEARSSIQSAKSAAKSEDFDRAKRLAKEGESRSQEAVQEGRRAVEEQRQIYLGLVREAQECAEAKSLIGSAQSAIQQAESEVSSASRQSWSEHVTGFGYVSHSVSSSDLSSANNYLSSARSDLNQAQSHLNARNYSSAQSEARDASSNAKKAESEADRVVRQERDEFDKKVRDAKASVTPPSGGGGGGTPGGGGGGGGVGGGGSGSTGGGW